jgi:hypothetical protein
LNFYDMMRQRAQTERDRRLAQTSMAVTDGATPQTVMPLQQQGPKMPRMFGGREVGPAPGAVAPQQFGPPMPPAFQVVGYTKGLQDAGPGAQAYADQFAGGDLSKVKARLMNIDGEMKNDYYTKGLLDFSPADANAAAPATSQQPDFLERLRMLFSGGGA